MSYLSDGSELSWNLNFTTTEITVDYNRFVSNLATSVTAATWTRANAVKHGLNKFDTTDLASIQIAIDKIEKHWHDYFGSVGQ